MTARVAIVGSGISGLALAFRLQQRLPSADVRVLESEPRVGGTIWTRREAGWQVELGPNGFLDNKPTTLQLARDLGLGDQLVQAAESAGKNRYLYFRDRLRKLPSGPGELLTTKLLSWRGKASLLMERFRRGKTDDADETIDAFARRRAGNEVADVLADGMVTGIFAGDPKLLSLPACFPRAAELEREYGSLMKGFASAAKKRRREAEARGETPKRGTTLWSLRGGLRTLVESLGASLKNAPACNVAVRGLARRGDTGRPSWSVFADGGNVWQADAVVLACPAHRQAPMLRDLDAALAREIEAIPFASIVVVGLGYRAADVRADVDGFGFIVPQSQRRDLLGVQWCSSIYPGRAPEGRILMRALCGGWQRSDIVDWDDDRLVSALRAELRQIQGIDATPEHVAIQRWRPAIPQYLLGHRERVSRIAHEAQRHPGLFLTGNSYRGVSMNDCAEQASLVAEAVAGYLSASG